MAVLLGWVDLPAALLILVMSLGGLLRRHDPAVARHDGARRHPARVSFGKVFGFVTTGFNLGGMVAP